MTILLALFLAECALDGWTTYRVLKAGGIELNTFIARAIAKYGKFKALLFFKVVPAVLVPIAIFIMLHFAVLVPWLEDAAFWLMAWICGGYALVIVNNYHVLLDIQPK